MLSYLVGISRMLPAGERASQGRQGMWTNRTVQRTSNERLARPSPRRLAHRTFTARGRRAAGRAGRIRAAGVGSSRVRTWRVGSRRVRQRRARGVGSSRLRTIAQPGRIWIQRRVLAGAFALIQDRHQEDDETGSGRGDSGGSGLGKRRDPDRRERANDYAGDGTNRNVHQKREHPPPEYARYRTLGQPLALLNAPNGAKAFKDCQAREDQAD